jgi:hypothetical protein
VEINTIILTIAYFCLFPEHGAAWLLGQDRWNAGQQLMASADPDKWAEFDAFTDLDRENRQAIADCQKMAKLNGKDRRCYLTVHAQASASYVDFH